MNRSIRELFDRIFFAGLIFVIIKAVFLDEIDEFVSWGSEIGVVINQLVLSYIGGYIFYRIANWESDNLEKTKNKLINKNQIKGLIFSIEKSIFTYICYVGLKDTLDFDRELMSVNLVGKDLKISIESESRVLNYLSQIDGDEILRPFSFYNELLNTSALVDIKLREAIANIQFMPLELVRIVKEIDDNFQATQIMDSLKAKNEHYKKRYESSNTIYQITKEDNEALNDQFRFLQKHLNDLKEYYSKEFDPSSQPIFSVKHYSWRPEYNLIYIDKSEDTSHD